MRYIRICGKCNATLGSGDFVCTQCDTHIDQTGITVEHVTKCAGCGKIIEESTCLHCGVSHPESLDYQEPA